MPYNSRGSPPSWRATSSAGKAAQHISHHQMNREDGRQVGVQLIWRYEFGSLSHGTRLRFEGTKREQAREADEGGDDIGLQERMMGVLATAKITTAHSTTRLSWSHGLDLWPIRSGNRYEDTIKYVHFQSGHNILRGVLDSKNAMCKVKRFEPMVEEGDDWR